MQTTRELTHSTMESDFSQIHNILVQWSADNGLLIQKVSPYNCAYRITLEDKYTVSTINIDTCDQTFEVKLWCGEWNRRFTNEPSTHAYPKIDRRLYLQTARFYMFRLMTVYWECVYCKYRRTSTAFSSIHCQKCDVCRGVYKQTVESIVTWLAIADRVDLSRDLVLLIARTLDELAQVP